EEATAVADSVELPELPAKRPWTRALGASRSGWAAAVLLALLWAFTAAPFSSRTMPTTDGNKSAGQVVGELPLVMLEAHRAEDGRLEVLYLRRVLERDRIDQMFEVQQDEYGEPVPVLVDWTRSVTSDPL
ncbi:MAG: hypothetical protein V3T77_04345, partial [Planctomycetota bacterium]